MKFYGVQLSFAAVLIVLMACGGGASPAATQSKASCRAPCVSGQFYPADQDELRSTVSRLLDQVQPEMLPGNLLAVMAPHAGYVYSGKVAAHSFNLLKNKDFKTIILLGNAHSVGFAGAAVYTNPCFRTPLGDVPVAVDITQALTGISKDVFANMDAHAKDHTLEVLLPFLQSVLSDFTIVPILFGIEPGAAPETIIRELPKLIRERKPLLVMSTDLSHYPTYNDARRVDSETLAAVVTMKPEVIRSHIAQYAKASVPNLSTVMCADTAVITGIQVAQALGADTAKLLTYANSGDAGIGGKDRVVGYGAVAFYQRQTGQHPDAAKGNEAQQPAKAPNESSPNSQDQAKLPEAFRLNASDKQCLLKLARATLESQVRTGKTPEITCNSIKVKEKRGAFVTLTIAKELRGCIGYIQPVKSLVETVMENTINAATRDHRFAPVTVAELDRISIEISALTPLQPITSLDEFVIGRDGIQLNKGLRSAVFLPQVAPEQGWTKEETVRHLCWKAGLPADAWQSGAEFFIFQADVFSEPEP